MVVLGNITLISDKEQAFFHDFLINGDNEIANEVNSLSAYPDANSGLTNAIPKFNDLVLDVEGENRVIQGRIKDEKQALEEYEVRIYLVVEEFIVLKPEE